jgi:two-component system alkaline phosphatase synthesis response regulator PhoP
VTVLTRDYDRVVIAEDELDRAQEMMQLLETIGGYQVWTTKWKAEVMSLLAETNAGWLILDLNLEDGNSAEIVPIIRKTYKKDVFILVLSGYFEDFPEYELLSGGADLYLRKPYRPKALLQQMESLRARMEGRELRQDEGIKLRFEGGILDVDRGIYRKKNKEIAIPAGQAKLIKLLASARDKDGWQYVDRPDVIMYLWGEDFDIDPVTTTERLRKVRARLRSTLGKEIIDIKSEGTGRLPSYKLSSEIEWVEEEE